MYVSSIFYMTALSVLLALFSLNVVGSRRNSQVQTSPFCLKQRPKLGTKKANSLTEKCFDFWKTMRQRQYKRFREMNKWWEEIHTPEWKTVG